MTRLVSFSDTIKRNNPNPHKVSKSITTFPFLILHYSYQISKSYMASKQICTLQFYTYFSITLNNTVYINLTICIYLHRKIFRKWILPSAWIHRTCIYTHILVNIHTILWDSHAHYKCYFRNKSSFLLLYILLSICSKY